MSANRQSYKNLEILTNNPHLKKLYEIQYWMDNHV